MNNAIIQFLQQETCASLCCIDEEGRPYCFSCYYAFNEDDGLLYFKSSANSHHIPLMKLNRYIAGTVLPDKLNKLVVRGIQLEGIALDPHDPRMKGAVSKYFSKHPMALAIPGEIWAIRIDHIKMTDSTLGFGKKLTWSRADSPEQVTAF